jgi:hypothetical protein
MDIAITFRTSKFDVSKETENQANQIYGESFLLWLKEIAKDRIELPEPDYEDWGWYSDVEWNGRVYMLGASSDDGSTWFFHITKQRTLKEKLFGKEKIDESDGCWNYLLSLIKSEPNFKEIELI